MIGKNRAGCGRQMYVLPLAPATVDASPAT